MKYLFCSHRLRQKKFGSYFIFLNIIFSHRQIYDMLKVMRWVKKLMLIFSRCIHFEDLEHQKVVIGMLFEKI